METKNAIKIQFRNENCQVGERYLTKMELYSLLTAAKTPIIYDTPVMGAGELGIVQSVSREDGSGRSFVLTYRPSHDISGNHVRVYFRTID